MAAITPFFQRDFKVYANRKIIVTKVRIVSTSDTFTLQPGANATNSVSVKQIRGPGESPVTSVAHVQSTGVVTIVSPASVIGKVVTLVSLHVDSNSSVLG